VTASPLSGRPWAQARWLHLLVLAIPFLVVIVAWRGLTQSFPAFQGADETIHFDVVRMAADQWPRPLLGGYGAWSGPFVYWLLAALAAPFGTSIEAVRLVVAAFSWGTCAIAYVIFRDRLGGRPLDALALALLLAVSPFFLGQSFHVLTDNPAWFFVILGLERCLAYVERPALMRIAAVAVCIAGATTMRHVAVWLLLPALVALLSVPQPRRRQAAGLGILALGVVPLLALLAYWGGPLPPPSVGAGAVETPLALGYRLRNVLLTLGVVGTYAILLLPAAEVERWWRRAHGDRRWVAVLLVPALVAVALVVAGALGVITSFLTLVSRLPLPMVAGSSVLWWLLIPLGAAAVAGLLVTRLKEARSRVLMAALTGVLLSSLANPRWFQRYVDFPVLLVLAGLALAAGVCLCRTDRERWLLTGMISLATFLWLL
jgi:4-amino-4-deoxy-L-arabinose transferase-like glycosyltransferase